MMGRMSFSEKITVVPQKAARKRHDACRRQIFSYAHKQRPRAARDCEPPVAHFKSMT
jgi:hypothetical protein